MKTESAKKNDLAMEQKDVINEYVNQTNEEEDVHFEHVDWTYGDSSCCC